jgi:uncharacterized coiled-coil protein SlyX
LQVIPEQKLLAKEKLAPVEEKNIGDILPIHEEDDAPVPSTNDDDSSLETDTNQSRDIIQNESTSLHSLEPETRSNMNDLEIEMDHGEKDKIALVRARRRKLRQRAKALMNAMEAVDNKNEPFVVLPMHQVDPTLSINVDQMFDPKLHPGVKRISAYDFEGMVANTNSNGSISLSDNHIAEITRPVSELKVSIEGLANSMKLLSNSVKESTTEKILSVGGGLEESQSTILQLQDEIAKLTRVLESLKPSVNPTEEDTSASLKRINSEDKSIKEEFGSKLLTVQDQDENSSDLVRAEVLKPFQEQQKQPQKVTTDNPEDLQIFEVFNPTSGRPDWFTSTSTFSANNKPTSDGKKFC